MNTKVNPNCLLFSERERGRESSKSSRVRGAGVGGGWSSDAMVLGKLSVPGRPTNLDNSRARVYCACSRRGWGSLDIFLYSTFYLFFLPLGKKA